MKEIGGYLELDNYSLPMLHEDAIALNCGRNALAYLIKAKNIKKIWLPYFLCDVVTNVCKKYCVDIELYNIGIDWLPKEIHLGENDYLYIVNYYGQLSRADLRIQVAHYKRVIIDNAQAYFEIPLENVDTIYTCRKFFGVSDGALLYTGDFTLEKNLPMDQSFERMNFVLGRYERSATEFYVEASKNNNFFDSEPIKKMSKLTRNLLHAIDYGLVKNIRTRNFKILHSSLSNKNELNLNVPIGAFMYPLMIDNCDYVRRKLLEHNIYIPVLWPNVIDDMDKGSWEYRLANNVLPLPCDQRYGQNEMEDIVKVVKQCIN